MYNTQCLNYLKAQLIISSQRPIISADSRLEFPILLKDFGEGSKVYVGGSKFKMTEFQYN